MMVCRSIRALGIEVDNTVSVEAMTIDDLTPEVGQRVRVTDQSTDVDGNLERVVVDWGDGNTECLSQTGAAELILDNAW